MPAVLLLAAEDSVSNCRRVLSPTGVFLLVQKDTKNTPKAFPLGYLPFREQKSSCGTFSSRRRCISLAAASADQNSKHCVSLGVPRFCVESQLPAAPRELVGNRQDNQRTGGENPKRQGELGKAQERAAWAGLRPSYTGEMSSYINRKPPQWGGFYY